jgi:hypothetical protein
MEVTPGGDQLNASTQTTARAPAGSDGESLSRRERKRVQVTVQDTLSLSRLLCLVHVSCWRCETNRLTEAEANEEETTTMPSRHAVGGGGHSRGKIAAQKKGHG